jgi:hypothetical protein
MMPGARFFFYSTFQPFFLPDGRAGRADYNQLRGPLFSPSSPLPLFVLTHRAQLPRKPN